MKNAPLRSSLIFLCLLVGACRPKAKVEGDLTVDGVSFAPASCGLAEGGLGVDLATPAGAHLTLLLPPQRIDYAREIRGMATVTYRAADGARVELGNCGTMMLRGEGYHEPRGRAVSGDATLACKGGVAMAGQLRFSGCF